MRTISRTITISENDITALRGALELAKDKYTANAKELREMQAPGYARLAEQFDRQANDATKLLDRIDY